MSLESVFVLFKTNDTYQLFEVMFPGTYDTSGGFVPFISLTLFGMQLIANQLKSTSQFARLTSIRARFWMCVLVCRYHLKWMAFYSKGILPISSSYTFSLY